MRKRKTPVAIAALTVGSFVALAGCRASTSGADEEIDREEVLDQAVEELVAMPGGPPAVVVVVQRGDERTLHEAGVVEVGGDDAPTVEHFMPVASVAKAFEGATVLALVDKGVLALEDTIAERLPDLPAAWGEVTLRQLLEHTSGVPDFTKSESWAEAATASPGEAPPPVELLAFVIDEPLVFSRGTRYEYSNSENVVVGLMIEAVTGETYEEVLRTEVLEPLGLDDTSLPAGPEVPEPYLHGYALSDDGELEDVTAQFAGGWPWASGGVVSTPADLNDFIRGYVGGELFDDDAREVQQGRFIPDADSAPAGPGVNSASMALFRYETECGTVYGHSGNTFGFTQLAVASPDGERSATVSMTLQRTQADEDQRAAVFQGLLRVERAAICLALD